MAEYDVPIQDIDTIIPVEVEEQGEIEVDFGEFVNIGSNGATSFVPDGITIKAEGYILSVVTADAVEEDNTLPVSSAAVYTKVGNIEALLKTI